MTNTKKCHKVAEWCGMRVLRIPWHDGDPGIYPPHFDDLNACRLFEQEAQRQGVLDNYCWILATKAKIELERGGFPAEYMAVVLMATPQQRLDAIVRVIEEQAQCKDKGENA